MALLLSLSSSNAQTTWQQIFASHVCDNGQNTLGGDSNCRGDDLTYTSAYGSWMVTTNGVISHEFMPTVTFPVVGFMKWTGWKLEFLGKGTEMTCESHVAIAAEKMDGSYEVSFFTISLNILTQGLEFVNVNTAPEFDGYKSLSVGFSRGGCVGPILIDEIQVSVSGLFPTPTASPTTTTTSTSTPTTPPQATATCSYLPTPIPSPTTCAAGNNTLNLWNGSQLIYQYNPLIFPTSFIWRGDGYSNPPGTFTILFDYDNGACSPNALPVYANGERSYPNIGDQVDYVSIYCGASGGGRVALITFVSYTYYDPLLCTTPAAPTPVLSCPTAIPSATNTTTITPTLNATQTTATANAAATLTAMPTPFGTLSPTAGPRETLTAMAATAEKNATQTRAAATNQATADRVDKNATGTAIALLPTPNYTPPKQCTNYSWFCYDPRSDSGGTCIYLSKTGYFDENCQGEFGLSNSACPVGYIPPDDKCGVISSPTPTGTPPPLGACLGPVNGSFESADYWDFRFGAVFDSASKAAILPANKGDSSVAPKLASNSTAFVIPTPAAGKYIIFSYDARTATCGRGKTTAIISFGGSDTILANPNLSTGWLNYQFDLSSKAGLSVTGMQFGNFDTKLGVIVDNLCIKESSEPPSDPIYTLSEDAPCVDIMPNITGCELIDQVLYDYGYDVRKWNAIYMSGVSLFSPSGWVPWLGAALWVAAAKPLACFMLEMYVSILYYLQDWINELVNWAWYFWKSSQAFSDWLGGVYNQYGTWAKANTEDAGKGWLNWWANQYRPWLDFTANTSRAWSQWLAANINGPLYEWLKWPSEVTSPWLLWLATSFIDLLLIPYALLSDFALKSIAWIDESLKWLVAKLLADALAIQAGGQNLAIEQLNKLINSYNETSIFGNSIGDALVQAAIETWNNSIYPPAQQLAATEESLRAFPTLLAAQFIEFIRTSFLMFTTFLTWLWALLTTYAMIPLQFLNGFKEGMTETPYGNIIECSNDNFWCAFFAGFQVINRSVAAAYAYPLVLITIIIGTIVIVWNAILAIVSIDIK